MALATEQLSLLLGQILSVGSRLNSQLIAIGGALASQIAEKAKGGEEAPAAEEAAAGEGAVPEAAAPAAEGGEAAAASTGLAVEKISLEGCRLSASEKPGNRLR